MKNWRTTVIGIGSAALYIGGKLIAHQPLDIADIGIVLGLLGFTVAKDAAVHSTVAETQVATAKQQADTIASLPPLDK